MSKSNHSNGADSKPANQADLAAQLRAAAEVLERAAANRAVLAELTQEERTRLLKAAGDVYCPDVRARRRLVKRNFQAAEEAESCSGIQTGVHHAQPSAAARIRAAGSGEESGVSRSGRAAELLHLQAGLCDDAPFLRPALSGVRGP
jgi:hypothetical protein